MKTLGCPVCGHVVKKDRASLNLRIVRLLKRNLPMTTRELSRDLGGTTKRLVQNGVDALVASGVVAAFPSRQTVRYALSVEDASVES